MGWHPPGTPATGATWKEVRGKVNSAGTGTQGAGFTATRSSTGVFSLSFSPAFSAAPNLQVTTEIGTGGSGAYKLVGKGNVTVTAANVYTYNSAGNIADSAFDFLASDPS